MMLVFFHFQHTLNGLYLTTVQSYIDIRLVHLEIWRGVWAGGQIDPPPPEKLPSKDPALLG